MRRVLTGWWVIVVVVSATAGADKNWNADSGQWTVADNWAPPGVPNAGHSVWIGYLSNSTCFLARDAGAAAATVTVNNGAALRLATNSTMLINTSATFDQTTADEVSLLLDSASTFRAPDVEFLYGAKLILDQGVMWATNELKIHSDSLIEGKGYIELDRAAGAGLVLNGTLTADGGQIEITTPGGCTVDLDGTTGQGVLNMLEPLSSVRVDGALTDWFGGQINIGESNYFECTEEWTCDGTINISSVAGYAYVKSPKTTLRGLLEVTARGRIDGPAELGPGSIVNVWGDLVTDEATLNGTWITGTGVVEHYGGDVTVTGDSTVDVDVYVLDAGRTMTVQPGVTFTINSQDTTITTTDNNCTNVFQLSNATLEFGEPWNLLSSIYLHDVGSGMIPAVNGATMTVDPAGAGDKGVYVEAGIGRINCKVVFENGGSGTSYDAILELNGGTTYRGGTHTGNGRLVQNGPASFASGTTTIAPLVYDWDGWDGNTTTIISSGATANIQPGSLDVDTIWDDPGFDGGIVIWDGAELYVNPALASSWELRGDLHLYDGQVSGDHLVLTGTVSGRGSITSSDLTNNGTIRGEGGTLRLDTAAFPDLDGDGAEIGTIEALDGDVVVGTAQSGPWGPFDGTIVIGDTHTFEIEHGGLWNRGLMELRGGTYEGPVLDHRGDMAVNTATSTLRTYAEFRYPSTTTLDAALRIAGTAEIFPGAIITGSGPLVILPGSTLCGDGVVDVGVINEGMISPGSSAGALECAAFTQGSKAVLQLDVGGATPGVDYDQFRVDGTADLSGTLQFVWIGQYEPTAGETFNVLSWTSRVGEFEAVLGWDMQTRALVPEYLSGGLQVTVAYFGDATLDGCVDGLDYNAWSLHYQAPAGWCEGDFNGDGTADGLDYNVWSLNYQVGCAGAAVPEPATLALLTLGACLPLLRRRR